MRQRQRNKKRQRQLKTERKTQRSRHDKRNGGTHNEDRGRDIHREKRRPKEQRHTWPDTHTHAPHRQVGIAERNQSTEIEWKRQIPRETQAQTQEMEAERQRDPRGRD